MNTKLIKLFLVLCLYSVTNFAQGFCIRASEETDPINFPSGEPYGVVLTPCDAEQFNARDHLIVNGLLSLPSYIGDQPVVGLDDYFFASSIYGPPSISYDLELPYTLLWIGKGAFLGIYDELVVDGTISDGSSNVPVSQGRDGHCSWAWRYVPFPTVGGGENRWTCEGESPPVKHNDSFVRLYSEDLKRPIAPKEIGIKTIYWPDGLEYIGAHAFFRQAIETLDLPDSVTFIGRQAFQNNRIKNLILPDGITEVSDYAFSNNLIQEINIPSSVALIGEFAFHNNFPKSINFSEGLETIEKYAFSCDLDKNNARNIVRENCKRGNKSNLTFPSTLKSIGEKAFSRNFSIKHLVLPNTIESIGSYAFDGSRSESLTTTQNSTHISDGTFRGMLLQQISFDNDILESIGKEAFYGNNLSSISFSRGLKRIGESAFSNSNIRSLNLPSNLEFIGQQAFSGNPLTSLKIPDSVTELGIAAFSNGVLETIELSTSLKSISAQAFSRNKLSHVTIPDGVTTIGESAFSQNNINHVDFPSSLENIETSAFESNDLTTFISPPGVSEIKPRSFADNKLERIIITDNVKTLKGLAFSSDKFGIHISPAKLDQNSNDIPRGTNIWIGENILTLNPVEFVISDGVSNPFGPFMPITSDQSTSDQVVHFLSKKPYLGGYAFGEVVYISFCELDTRGWPGPPIFGVTPISDGDCDNDGVSNNEDLFPYDPLNDSDGDDNANLFDRFPMDPEEYLDTDLDFIGNNRDTDDDNDGWPDVDDIFPLNASEHADSDADGVGDNTDVFLTDSSEYTDNDSDGIGDNADTDDDNDGVLDINDAFPFDSSESVDTDSDGIGNNADTNDDGDRVSDNDDAFPLDPKWWRDNDSDGVDDSIDPYEYRSSIAGSLMDTDLDGYPNKCPDTYLSYCEGMRQDGDDDDDGWPDENDVFPLDAAEHLDTDGDGVGDNADIYPSDASESTDTDFDGIGNNADTDDDNDGVLDDNDPFPMDASESVDTDSDGIGNNADTDDDGDGVSDNDDAFPLNSSETVDTDSDGIGNNADTDDDNDGVPDNADSQSTDPYNDSDEDGVANIDDTFPLDAFESVDTDSDGIGNNADDDDDGDTVLDIYDEFPLDGTEWQDFDADGVGNNSDLFPYDARVWADFDMDGVGDNLDAYPNIALNGLLDTDSDGRPDECDVTCLEIGMIDDHDDDGDSLSDSDELNIGTNPLKWDTDGDTLSDKFEIDSNSRSPLKPDYFLVGLGPVKQFCVTSDDLGTCNRFGEIGRISQLEGSDTGILCALEKISGRVHCDFNSFDSRTFDISPELIAGFPGDGYSKIAVGGNHVCAIKSGDVVCIGENSSGQLDGPSNLTNVIDISAGNDHTCALTESHEVMCWTNHESLVDSIQPPSLNRPVTIKSKGGVTCAIDLSRVVCWGKVGRKGFSYDETPQIIESNISFPIKDFDIGNDGRDGCVIDAEGPKCWGSLSGYLASSSYNHTMEKYSLNYVQVTIRYQEVCLLPRESEADNSQTLDPSQFVWCWGPSGFSSRFPTIDSIYDSGLIFGDFDLDSVKDDVDLDDDNDSFEDLSDVFPLDASESKDSDNDGIGDNSDALPNDPTESVDTDSDGIGNNADNDDDNDGVFDLADAYPLISLGGLADNDSDGRPDDCDSVCIDLGMIADTDDDNDGVLDIDDAFPFDSSESVDTDSDGIGNNADTDDDGDSISDIDEISSGSNPLLADTDGDGVNDNIDAFPLDSAESSDSDGDGLGDNADAFPNDSSETVDSDSDGVGDNADVFPNDPTESADTDLDGVGDNADVFPSDASETVDSDSDGTGDNSDAFPNNSLYKEDSDSDGMPDSWEIRYGLNPNDPSDAISDRDNDGVTALDEFLAGTIPSGSIDLDGNDQYDALTDGLLLLRGMFGLDGSALVTGTIASDAVYNESVDIESRIEMLGDLADIDGNGDIDALTDGLLTLRYLFGLQGDTLINGVVAGDATRTTAEEIEAHLEALMPAL